MGVFGWVAIGVIGYFLYSRVSTGQSLLPSLTPTSNAAALQTAQQNQLRALAAAVNNKQTATTQQINALNQALQQLAKQSASGSGKGGGGSAAPSGGGGAAVGAQKQSQAIDPLSQLFLQSDLNGPQASAAQNVLQQGGTIADAAAAAGVTPDQIIQAISPQIENIIQATAPSPVASDLGTDNLVQIDPTPLIPVDQNSGSADATWTNTGAAVPDTTASGSLVQIDPVPLIDTSGLTQQTDGSVVGQDPNTDPSFLTDNSLLGSTFTPSTTDMSSNINSLPYDPSTDPTMDSAVWSGGDGGGTTADSGFSADEYSLEY